MPSEWRLSWAKPESSTIAIRPEWRVAWIGLSLRGSVFFLAFPECHVARRITRGSLSCGMESLEKGDQRRGLWRTQVFSVRRHVAASLDHLADELVLRQPYGYGV